MKKPEQRDLFPGALEMMILRTLKRQPLHGYALAQHIKRTSNGLLQIEEGSLYPALQRLLGGAPIDKVGAAALTRYSFSIAPSAGHKSTSRKPLSVLRKL
jgi:hypothetical protein